MRKYLPLFYSAAALSLSACQSFTPVAGIPDRITDSRWVLTSGEYQGKPLNTATGKVTLNIDKNGQFSGVAALNQYHAPVRIRGTALEHTGEIITTRMAGALPLMRLESHYLSAVRQADTVSEQDNTLIISGNGVQLRFHRATQ